MSHGVGETLASVQSEHCDGVKGGGRDVRDKDKSGCFQCGFKGHVKAQCPMNPQNRDKDKVCDSCKKRGHVRANCRANKGNGKGKSNSRRCIRRWW